MDEEIYDRIIFLADPELSEPVLVIGLEGAHPEHVLDGTIPSST